MRGDALLWARMTQWAKENAHKIAIIEADTGRSMSYQELVYAVAAVSNSLGTRPVTIMVVLPGSIVDAVLWLSCLITGHLLIPVSPTLTEFEYKALISKHAPDLLIIETPQTIIQETIKQITFADCQTMIQKGIAGRSSLISEKSTGEGSICLTTSGSTGEPKGVVLSATKIMITAQNIAVSHRITKEDRGFTSLPFHHVNAPVVSLVSSILVGSTIIIAPKYSTTHFWKWVEKYDPTWISIVPTIATMLLNTDRPDFLRKSSLRFVRTASAPMPAVTLKRFEEKFGIPLIETYGITEAASTITANPVPPGIHKAGSVGLPIGITIRIYDSVTFEEVPSGTMGEVWIKGQQVISSYESNKDPESFKNGWFRTGDLGYFDRDGYLFLTGRKKEIIIRGGENISPREIEEALLTFSHIQEAAVVGVPDPLYGEKVVAFVVFDTKENEEKSSDIRDFLRQKLSPEKQPSNISVLDKLPRGKTGKIDKTSLKASAVT